MPSAQVRNQAMQALGSPDHLFAYDRNFAATFYDSSGNQIPTYGNNSYLNLNAIKVNPAPEIFSLLNSVVTIAKAGMYLFSFQVMTMHNGGLAPSSIRVFLDEDPATGSFATAVPAITYFSMPEVASGIATGTVTIALKVGINYRYRVGFMQNYGSTPIRTVGDGSFLSITTLFINQ